MRQVGLYVAMAVAATAVQGRAQTAAPKPLTERPAVPAASASAGQAQDAPKAPANPFPPVDPKNFTAPSPTVETVNSFLHALWGYDPNRIWSVSAIEPTAAPGVVQVRVLVAEKNQPSRVGQTVLFITPDGKHAIAGEVVNFGAQPFAATRTLLQQRADGPARGASGKDLELVEFADLQCQTCKAAQTTLNQLQQDFPQAHIVYENAPLAAGRPFATQAAAVGQCVRTAKGDAAFFTYAQKVYDTQADLSAEKADATLRAAATAAGADPAAAMTCASSPAAKDAVNATVKLASDAGISGTPTLVVNGRPVPLGQVPYETLKRVIVFQGQLDGVAVQTQPSLTTLK